MDLPLWTIYIVFSVSGHWSIPLFTHHRRPSRVNSTHYKPIPKPAYTVRWKESIECLLGGLNPRHRHLWFSGFRCLQYNILHPRPLRLGELWSIALPDLWCLGHPDNASLLFSDLEAFTISLLIPWGLGSPELSFLWPSGDWEQGLRTGLYDCIGHLYGRHYLYCCGDPDGNFGSPNNLCLKVERCFIFLS